MQQVGQKSSMNNIDESIEQNTIRVATLGDITAIAAFDLIAQGEPERQRFIDAAVMNGQCWVLEIAGEVTAYIIMSAHFFGWPFIDLVYVRSDQRQFGYATALMRHIEAICGREKLFTSTNLSNLAMQRLLEKLGYTISGVVHNLDEGDPEVFYFKRPTVSGHESGYNMPQVNSDKSLTGH